MKIIVEINDIPKNDHERWVLSHGTPLPKGHGKLMILSKDKVKENQIDLDFYCQKWISEVGLSNATVAIIAAESEEKNENCN